VFFPFCLLALNIAVVGTTLTFKYRIAKYGTLPTMAAYPNGRVFDNSISKRPVCFTGTGVDKLRRFFFFGILVSCTLNRDHSQYVVNYNRTYATAYFQLNYTIPWAKQVMESIGNYLENR